MIFILNNISEKFKKIKKHWITPQAKHCCLVYDLHPFVGGEFWLVGEDLSYGRKKLGGESKAAIAWIVMLLDLDNFSMTYFVASTISSPIFSSFLATSYSVWVFVHWYIKEINVIMWMKTV